MNQSRREFLGLGFGVLCASALGDAAIRLDGKMNPITTVVAEPWNDGLLNVRSYTLEVGATAPFRAIHFSDTHINLSDIEEMYRSPKNYSQGVMRYARFPQAIPSFYATLDFAAKEKGTLLLHSGDLIDFGTRASYAFLRHNLKGLDLHYAIGNHEYEKPDSSYNPDVEYQLKKLAETGVSPNLLCSSRIVNGVNFVAFDNARFGKGIVLPEVRDAIRREFEKGLPVVLMCHQPPYLSTAFQDSKLQEQIDASLQRLRLDDIPAYQARSHAPRWDGDEDTVAFWKGIRELDNFKAVLCGHCHWAWNEPFGKGRLYIAGANYEGAVNEFRFL